MSSNNAPPSDQAGTSPSPRRKKMLSFDTIAANQDFFFVDESLPPAAAAVTAMVAGDGGQRSRQSSHEAGHPAMTAAPFSQQSMMGPILRRKRVVSMPLGGNSANELLFFGDRRGVPVASHPIHTVIDEAASAITEEGSASNLMATPASRAPPAGHHRVRQSTAPAGGGGGLFDAQVGTAGGGPARRARPHRGKSNSFMAGVLARRAVAMDMLPSEEADLGVYEFFQPIADAIKRAPVLPAGLDRGEECKEEMEEEDQDLEEGDVVGEQAPAVEEFVEGAAGEGEAAAARGEAKKKLFKPLVFAPHVVPRGGSAGHGHHGGGHGAHLPAPSAKTEVLTAPEAVPLAGGEGMIPEEGADTSGESEEDIEGADLLEKYDDSHIIRATRKDYFYTGILFCVMAALVGVVVGWDTHLDESDSIFGPVGLACKTPCRGDIYDQDYFRGRNTFETGNVIFLNPHIDATLTKNSYLRMVIRGVESNMTKWVSLDDVFGPASVEGERVTKEERVTVDWEYPGEQHVIDVISTTGSQELPPPYTEALEAEEELHSEEEHADEESHANNATGGVATTKEGESDAGDSEGEAASQFHRLLSSSSGGDNSATLGIPHHGELTYSLYASTLHPISRSSVLVAAIIMIIVYIFILLEVIHRTLVAIFGSFVALFFFFLMHDGHTESISTLMLHMEWSTLGLLFGMMLLVGELSHTGVFEWCAVRLLFASKGSFNRLMMLLCSLVALSSAFLDNVTTMLLIAPVTIDMCGILGVDPRPYLIGEVLLSNVGGTATLIGVANLSSLFCSIDFLSRSSQVSDVWDMFFRSCHLLFLQVTLLTSSLDQASTKLDSSISSSIFYHVSSFSACRYLCSLFSRSTSIT